MDNLYMGMDIRYFGMDTGNIGTDMGGDTLLDTANFELDLEIRS